MNSHRRRTQRGNRARLADTAAAVGAGLLMLGIATAGYHARSETATPATRLASLGTATTERNLPARPRAPAGDNLGQLDLTDPIDRQTAIDHATTWIFDTMRARHGLTQADPEELTFRLTARAERAAPNGAQAVAKALATTDGRGSTGWHQPAATDLSLAGAVETLIEMGLQGRDVRLAARWTEREFGAHGAALLRELQPVAARLSTAHQVAGTGDPMSFWDPMTERTARRDLALLQAGREAARTEDLSYVLGETRYEGVEAILATQAHRAARVLVNELAQTQSIRRTTAPPGMGATAADGWTR